MARPTKISDQKITDVQQVILRGGYIETAAAYAGINKSTFYDWLKRGQREKDRVAKNPEQRSIRKAERPFVEFSDAVERALAQAEVRDLEVVDKAAQGGREVQRITERYERVVDAETGEIQEEYLVNRTEVTETKDPEWRAAAWKLERRNPEKWGRRRLELTGADGDSLRDPVSVVIPDNRRKDAEFAEVEEAEWEEIFPEGIPDSFQEETPDPDPQSDNGQTNRTS